jgi:iron-sulfur cluster repair protein YtfE (RIC family)
MGPEQVRATLLEDHARLRLLFQELDGAARRVLTGDALLAFRMRVLAEALREQVLAHLALEDRLLLPVLRDDGAEGAERARGVAREHRSQRERLGLLLDEFSDARRAPEALARSVRELVADLLDHMVEEERTTLVGILGGRVDIEVG